MSSSQDPTADVVIVRDRDAQAAIRGFVYQIDLTLVRWLKLADNEVLFPERAEDIDVVAQWIDGGSAQLLEQVKNLSNPITLNTPAVRAALAGFYEHAAANPGKNLQFRFATNARVVRERTSHFDDKTPGIHAWNEIRTSADAARPQRLQALRQTFADAARPDELAEATWQPFISFAADGSDAELERFVRSVEFSPELDEHTETKRSVTGLLASSDYCSSDEDAEAAYLALFHFLTRLLCAPPPRHVRRADIGDVIRRGYSTSPRVALALKLLDERVSALEVEVKRLARTEASLSLSFTTTRDLTTLPPLPAIRIDRNELADALIARLAQGRLVAVTGQLGMGKTHLIRLALERMKQSFAWLRLRDVEAGETALRLGRVVEYFEGKPAPDVLVLDDMPLLNYGSEALRDGLLAIPATDRWKKTKLISSSAGIHSDGALASFPEAAFVVFPIPTLSITEARSYVLALGGNLADQGLEYLLQVTSAHPQMFVAVCRYLAANQWAFGTQVLLGLLERRFADGLTAETAQRFIATVQDESSRELVHRMRLCVKRARTNQLHVLSGVEPTISDPLTRVSALDGVWLQQDAVGEWILSPLLQSLPADALPEARRIACHAALANSFDEDGTINVVDVPFVLLHMRGGRLYDEFVDLFRTVAGEALARSMGSTGRVANSVLRGLTLIDVPADLDHADRVLIRGLQLASKLQLKQTVAPAETKAIADAELPADSTLLLAATLGFRLRGRDAVRLIGRAIRLMPEGSELHRERHRLFTALTSLVGDAAGFAEWLQLLTNLTQGERTAVEDEDLWPGGVMALFEDSRQDNSEELHLELTRRAQATGSELQMPMLFAAAARAEAFATMKRDNAAALGSLEAALAETSPESRERGLVLAAITQLALRDGNAARAIDAAEQAMGCAVNGIEYQAAQCALRGGIAAAALNQVAVPLAAQAVSVSRGSELVSPGFLIRSLGELGTAHWVAGNQVEAVRAYVECADRLLMAGECEHDWRQLVPVTVHVLNYVAAKMRGVNLTQEANGFPYAPPTIGFFFNADEKYETAYKEEKPIVLAALLVALAGRIADWTTSDRAAALLADRLQLASAPARIAAAMNAGPYMASRGLIEELISCAWSSLSKPHPADLPSLPKNWDDRDQSVLLFGLPQSALGVCLGLLDNPEVGRERLSELSNALRRLDADGSQAGWSKVADLVEMSCNSTVSRSDVVKAVNAEPNGIIQSVLMLLSVFHPQATPEFAARSHALAIPPIWPMFLKEADTADLLLVPCLFRYWERVVAEQDYRFRRPTEIAAEVTAASKLGGLGARVSTLIRAVLDGLGVDVQFDRGVFIEPS